VRSPFSYCLVPCPPRRERPALAAFESWLLEEAALTRADTQEDTRRDAVHDALADTRQEMARPPLPPKALR
jgi:hypothetical protein